MAARKDILKILEKSFLDASDIEALLVVSDAETLEAVRLKAEAVTLDHHGPEVHFRGLSEFSNICARDCMYCGIRKSITSVKRYLFQPQEIIRQAGRCADLGYGSIVLQSGERRDPDFIDLVEEVVRGIKEETRSYRLPEGLGITLCVGEQTPKTYERFRAAGAHRYLLRIESSSPELFSKWHPATQRHQDRLHCLNVLKEQGFQVGTGVMIGAPWQTVRDLAQDVLFFRDQDVDMVGMGPYVPHRETPLGLMAERFCPPQADIFTRSLLMIAATRLVMPDVNIAATTALQTISPQGRELGIAFGANVIMPKLTPPAMGRAYQLYDGKPFRDENHPAYRWRLESRIRALGRKPEFDTWGDAPHFFRRSPEPLSKWVSNMSGNTPR